MTPSRLDVERVSAALTVMIQKVDRADPFGLAVDSAAVGRRQLERHFSNLKTSPHRELCRIRIELAAGELTSRQGTSAHLEGVSRRLGYQDERRLREAVGKAYGLSPREMRTGARIQRNLKQDEEIRRKWRGSRLSVGLWSDYRRRRNREILQKLLKKAKPVGAKVMLGDVSFPRPAKAREMAADLAKTRVLQLYAAATESRKRAA
jgi:AraC-like DNA-binding protein